MSRADMTILSGLKGDVARGRARIVEKNVVRRMAYILGEQSAAALALADHARRVEAGESPVFILAGATILVGPDPTTLPLTSGETDEG